MTIKLNELMTIPKMKLGVISFLFNTRNPAF